MIFLPLTFLLLELVGYVGLWHKTKSKLINTSPRVPHETLGHWHPTNEKYLASKSCIEDTCFKDIEYRFDQYGRRVGYGKGFEGVPIILLGDSSVFGVGLPFEQTLGARLSVLFNRPVLNYGINDADPHLALGLLKRRILQDQIPKESDLLVILTRPLIERLLPSLKNYERKNKPIYHLTDDGKWEYFKEGNLLHPDQYSWFAYLRAIKKHSFFLTWLDIDYSFFTQAQREERLARHYQEITRLYNQDFSGQIFLVEHPHKGLSAAQMLSLKKLGLPALEMELPPSFQGQRDLCECDSNPSAEVNKVFSEMLHDKLKEPLKNGQRPLF